MPIMRLKNIQFHNVTPEVKKYFLLDKKDLMAKPKVSYKTNNVILTNVLILGNQGTGKTTTVNSIANMFVKKYGRENVNCVMSDTGDLEMLLEGGFKDKLINIVFADNITSEKINDSTLKEYFRCRKILNDEYDRYNGHIITFFGVHRYHSSPKELRANESALIVRDSTAYGYDRNLLIRRIGEKNVKIFDAFERARLKNRALFKYSYFCSKTINGWMSLSMPKEYMFTYPDITLFEK
jgi:DNA polymerase III delta prime subunit